MDNKEMILDYKEQNLKRLAKDYILKSPEAFIDKMLEYDYIDIYDMIEFYEEDDGFQEYVEEKFKEACEEHEASQIL